MKLFHAPDHPSHPVDAAHFTGTASVAHIERASEDPPMNVYRVRFHASARTAWHTHTGVQLLLIVEGCCRIQKAGEPIQDVAAGGAIRIEAGERHWHGATPDGPMTHLALNINTTTHWFEKVIDAEYAGVRNARGLPSGGPAG